jgi:PPM family protein phosphatase
MKGEVEVDVARLEPRPDDVYLLCSDGLSGMIDDEEILSITQEHNDLEAACSAMVDAANEAGGSDNVTVAMIRLLED